MSRLRKGIGFYFPLPGFILCVMLLMVLVACADKRPTDGSRSGRSFSSENNVEAVLRELVRRYETRNSAGVLDFIHSNYQDTEGNRNDLRYRVSRVHDQYGTIDAQVRISRSIRRNANLVLETRWTLSWVCRTTGPGCYTNGETVDRSGRSQFTFSRESGQWRLHRQEGAALFGSFQPGRVDP